ncbi:MAG TPA: hypothetical protein VFG50_09025 [Rhodothermales bacterium]|nr:hypothetical protein [Rhodothermales bacterium]
MKRWNHALPVRQRDAPVLDKAFERMEDLEAALAEHCRQLAKPPEEIRTRTCYHRWPGGIDHSITL